MQDISVSTSAELQELLFADSWNEELGRFRPNIAFRRRWDAQGTLSTSLMKLGGDAASLEGHLVRSFRKYAASESVPVDSLWNWLALGQHHGLPTRMLDWTYSPDALHFVTATIECFERDRAVWMVDYVGAHEHLPDALRAQLETEGANVFTTEMLGAVAAGVDEFAQLGEDFVVFLEAPSFDERIVNQYALFSFVGGGCVARRVAASASGACATPCHIPAELKWEVRDKLDLAGINERVVLPGLHGLTRWVARYYAPRRP